MSLFVTILLLLLIGSVVHETHASSPFNEDPSFMCGDTTCTTSWSPPASPCPDPDISAITPDVCYESRTTCGTIVPPLDTSPVNGVRPSVYQCLCTCSEGIVIPSRCCADVGPQINIVPTPLQNALVYNIFSPNDGTTGHYPSNTRCSYAIQCPSDEYLLYYTFLRHDISDHLGLGFCLDFIRLHLTAFSNPPIVQDLCGGYDDIPPGLASGFHGTALDVEFRSNRLITDLGFYLSGICFKPALQNLQGCQPPVVRRRRSAEEDLILLNKKNIIRDKRSGRVSWIIVDRFSEVRYQAHVVTVVRKGETLHTFKNIRMLQVYNRVESFQSFYTNITEGRAFLGYGHLSIGNGVISFVQTIVEPEFLLSALEESIIRGLLSDLFIRGRLNADKYSVRTIGTVDPGPDAITDPVPEPDCGTLTEALDNQQSCSAVLRAVSEYYLDIEKDSIPRCTATGTKAP